MPANPTEPTPLRSGSAPVEGIKARRSQRVLNAVGKAFGSIRTERDPESGTYHVVSAVDASQLTTTSSQTAGTDQERFRHNSREYFVIDDLLGFSYDAYTTHIMQEIFKKYKL